MRRVGCRFVEERNVTAAYIQTCVGSTATTRLRPAGTHISSLSVPTPRHTAGAFAGVARTTHTTAAAPLHSPSVPADFALARCGRPAHPASALSSPHLNFHLSLC